MINNYSVLRKVISKELCDFLYEYLKKTIWEFES